MAGKGTTLNKALTSWEEKNGMSYTEATEIKLIFQVVLTDYQSNHLLKSSKPQF
jgi:hypothetical protein